MSSSKDFTLAFGPTETTFVFIAVPAWYNCSCPRSNAASEQWVRRKFSAIYSFAFINDIGFFSVWEEDGKVAWDLVPGLRQTKPTRLCKARRWKDKKQSYERLSGWLKMKLESPEHAKELKIAFGSGGSYFAWIKRQHEDSFDYFYSRLPESFESHFKSETREDKAIPHIVSLGINSTWAVIWSDGRTVFNLGKDYQTLQKRLDMDTSDSLVIGKSTVQIHAGIENVSLSHFSSKKFWIRFSNGQVSSSMNRKMAQAVRKTTEHWGQRRVDQTREPLTIHHEDGACTYFTPRDLVKKQPVQAKQEVPEPDTSVASEVGWERDAHRAALTDSVEKRQDVQKQELLEWNASTALQANQAFNATAAKNVQYTRRLVVATEMAAGAAVLSLCSIM